MATRLNITYSAYRELETIPQSPLREATSKLPRQIKAVK